MSFIPYKQVGTRIAPDANDVGVYVFSEPSGNFLNSGSGAGTAFQDIGTTAAWRQASGIVTPYAVGIAQGTTLSTTTGAGTDGNLELSKTPGFSVSCWIKLFACNFSASVRHIIDKLYRPIASGWSSPFTATNAPSLYVTANANAWVSQSSGVASIGAVSLGLGSWHHIMSTWDGTTSKIYADGVLATSAAASGAQDYGSHGPWVIGQNPASGAEAGFQGLICDLRFANIARAASYARQVYRAGMGLT